MRQEEKRRFGVVSDEVHPDPAVAFRMASELGMGHVDLNSLWGKPVTKLDDGEVGKVKEFAERYGLKTTMVAGLSFKTLVIDGFHTDGLLAAPEFKEHMDVLERSMEIASMLGAPLVRVFSFRWPEGGGNPSPRHPQGGEIPQKELDLVAAGLRAACDLARRYDVTLGLENVRSCYGNSGRNTGRIVDAVGDDRLKVVWDPANAYVSGEDPPFPGGYEAIKEHMVHFHAKDARVAEDDTGLTAWECIGTGAVDYGPQFDALRDYSGGITLETHWCPEGTTKEEASRESFKGLLAVWEETAKAG